MKNYYNFTKANLKDTNYNLPTRQIFPFIKVVRFLKVGQKTTRLMLSFSFLQEKVLRLRFC